MKTRSLRRRWGWTSPTLTYAPTHFHTMWLMLLAWAVPALWQIALVRDYGFREIQPNEIPNALVRQSYLVISPWRTVFRICRATRQTLLISQGPPRQWVFERTRNLFRELMISSYRFSLEPFRYTTQPFRYILTDCLSPPLHFCLAGHWIAWSSRCQSDG